MCEHFRDYSCINFDVYTDYNLLKYIQSSCKVNAIGHRLINKLTHFSFTLYYKTAVENVVAKSSSWSAINNIEDLQALSGLCSVDEVKAIFDGAVNQAHNDKAWLPKVNMINANLEIQLLYSR